MPVNVLTNSTLTSAVSSRVASSGFLAKIIISNIDKMKESVNDSSRGGYALTSCNGYLLYIQNNNTMDMLGETMNTIYDAESLFSHLDEFLSDERRRIDFELGEVIVEKEKLEAKIEKKEAELFEEEDESTQISLKNKIDELEDALNTLIKEEEEKRELICSHDSLIDDVYTIKSGFSKALHDAVTSGKYTENGEHYIFIRSNEMNTSLTNIFDECTVYESDIFENFEVVDVEMDAEEDLEQEGEEHTGEEDNQDVDEDGFQRLPSTVDEDVSNSDDDPSSDDESDDHAPGASGINI